MTNKEAIHNLDAIGNILGDWFPGETSEPFKESLCMGILGLENKLEAEEYRTPKKVKKTKMTPLCFGCNVKLETGICPNCTFDKVIKDSQYCPYCGQALYWG